MSYMRHHAIVVTSWNEKMLALAHAKAKELFRDVAGITSAIVNGYCSFLIAPDGSKEGWEHSDRADAVRDVFISWLHDQRCEDDSNSLEYFEIEFGGNGGKARIVRSNSGRL